MEISEAIYKVEGIGESYFYDFVEEDNIDSILQQIADHVMGTKITAIHSWTNSRDALRKVLPVMNDEDLDLMIKSNFGIWPDEVGGGRAFLRRLCDLISESIEQKLQKGC